MSLWEKSWDADDKRCQENYEKNMECFKELSDKEKFELLWNEYVSKHSNDVGLYNLLKK